MFKKLACFTGWLLILSLSLLFCFTLGLWQNWNTPAILLFWLLLLVLAILMWGVIHTFTKVIKGKQKFRLLEKYRLSRQQYVLLDHWKRGASIIKRIRRQQTQLPWYLMVGDRCGKSTLLAGARLPRFDGESDDMVVTPTRTLRWWFFRQLCVLDLSSNFLNGSTTLREAWGKLTRWCARIPAPAGVIIVLPMSALMSDDLNALHSLTRQQRSLIEPLVRRFGKRLPLYVMVTQCDHFPGFSLWHQQLSPAQCQQPLGYSWPTPPQIDGQDEFALRPLFAALKEGMSYVRLSMSPLMPLSAQDNAILLGFPEAFATLEPRLRYALASLCEPNAYFSQPKLSSVWFSATEPQDENTSRRASVFVHDLLTGHLRNLSLRRENQRWYQQPRGKIACSVVLMVCVLWLAISASLNFSQLRQDVSQLSPDALAAFLARDENNSSSELANLPFGPLLQKHHQQAESQLVRSVISTPRLAQNSLAEFQRQVLAAEPAHQRELILQLTHAVLVWQQMYDGETLEAISHNAPIAPTLMQRNYPDTLSPQVVMALERIYIQRPEGLHWLQAARRLLETLVNHYPDLNWLLAPSSTLPALQASSLWPSLPESIALPGIWTLTGEASINDWMSQIERAIGGSQQLFDQARKNIPNQRQNAWKKYLIDVATSLASARPSTLSHEQLIALGQNQSQVMKFSYLTLDELKDIPPAQAQPWLGTLRQLQQLALNEQASTFIDRATKVNNRVRQSFTAWLQGTSPTPQTGSAPATALAWKQWKNARNSAVKEALTQGTPDAQLTSGLFSPVQESSGHNPLKELLPALTTLRERLTPDNNDAGIAAVWQLHQYDDRRLLGNAVSQSACWLNTQWESTVLWPLDKDNGRRSYDEQQILSQQLISTFLRGPAKTLLTNSSNGPIAADYAGIKVPLSDEFIHLTQQAVSPEIIQNLPQRASTFGSDRQASLQQQRDALAQKQSALENKSWKIRVTSQPATVPGGARVIPTGTVLTLNCLKGDQQLSNMNFAEKRDFNWQPGQCPGMTLAVIFPDFTAYYQLTGDDAWPSFVRNFADGEVLLDATDFGDSAEELLHMGIKQILVRFTVSSPQEMENAWQDWNRLNDKVSQLDEQISAMDEQIDSRPVHPISALPDTIAQCQ